MKVRELIEHLKAYDQDLEVVQSKFSEHCLIEESDIEIVELCQPRRDGWVHDKRPDRETRHYLRVAA